MCIDLGVLRSSEEFHPSGEENAVPNLVIINLALEFVVRDSFGLARRC